MAEAIRIIILEDNPVDVELIEFELQEAGLVFTAKVVMTEEDFISALQTFLPDLILSDYDLPRYNGALALAEVRKRCPDTPFILVTGAVSEDRAIEILTMGAKDYVLKDRLQQRLITAIRRALTEADEHQARKQAERKLRDTYRTLEERVKIRTAELEAEVAMRKETEAALRASEQRFRDLLQTIPNVAVQGYGPDGTTQYWNQASEHVYGYSSEEAVGRNLVDLIIPPEMKEDVRQAIRKMAETGQPIPAAELSLMRKDGSRVPVYSSHTILNIPGREPELFCIDIDLTSRKLSEEALRESEERYRNLVRFAPAGIFEVNFATGQFMEVNDAMCQILGYSRNELLAMVAFDLLDDEGRILLASRICLERIGKRPEGVAEYRVRTKDGSLLWVLMNAEFHWDDGNIVRATVVAHDITERKKTEDALRESNKELTRFNIAAVDREVRMIELKKEVNELYVQIGRPPRYPLDFEKEKT